MDASHTEKDVCADEVNEMLASLEQYHGRSEGKICTVLQGRALTNTRGLTVHC